MPVGLAQVVFGVPVRQEGLDALRAFGHDDGVKQDGKIGGQAAVHQQVFPFFRFNGSHMCGNDLGMGLLPCAGRRRFPPRISG